MKLSKVKSWLTPEDAAKRLSASFGEDVSATDVIQLGLEGRLTLSVRFANIQEARRVKATPIAEAKYDEATFDGQVVRLYGGPVTRSASGEERVLVLGDPIRLMVGVYDLPMIGDDHLMVEREYQKLTNGHDVTDVSLDGAFVSAGGEMFQLLPDGQHPLGMPEDATVVVRTAALGDFEQGQAEGSKVDRHPNMPAPFLAQVAAFDYWWKNCERDDPSMHHRNADIAKWMVDGYNLSQTMADACAKAIRPEWAAKGRTPER